MKIIVFDTETTGLPKKRHGLIEDDKNWPHMVQLAWLVVEAGVPVSRVVQPMVPRA